MSKQRKFSDKKGDFNGIEDITEVESHHYPIDQRGRKGLDESYESIYEYEILEPIVIQTRIDFYNETKSLINTEDLTKIEEGLKDYVKSANTTTKKLSLLKKSILNAFGNDLLTSKYFYSSEGIKQIINQNYFEDYSQLTKKKSQHLISRKSIEIYKERATHFTVKALIEYFEKSEQCDYEDARVHRGIGNVKYEDNDRNKNKFDFISTFTGILEPISYFESKLLNSYSLNRIVAEQFMISKLNTRKAFVEIEWKCLVPNIFSSFIVSDIFDYEQYEFLTLPNQNDMFIVEDVNDSICAEYYISDSEMKKNRVVRKNYDKTNHYKDE